MLAPVDEWTLDELTEGHRYVYPELAGDLAALAPEAFFAPQGELWSPAEHVDHLVRSVTAVVGALKWPRFVLRLLFGSADASRPAEEVLATYLERLEAGAGARGRFVPSVEVEEPTEARQQQLLFRCRWLGQAVSGALFRWRDAELDRYRLPHPLLGKLTIREMLAWSLYHARHHHRRVLERLPGG